ncbi:MAG: flagellar basal body P-ring formation chaperone FlgA, partial [Fibrobacterota bacterium]
CLVTAAAAGGAYIDFRDEVHVAGDSLTLGDAALVRGQDSAYLAEQVLVAGLSPGRTRVIQGEILVQRLPLTPGMKERIHVRGSMSSRVHVAADTIRPEKMSAQILHLLKDSLEGRGREIRFTADTHFVPIAVHKDSDVDLTLEKISSRSMEGRARAVCRIKSSCGVQRRISVPVYIARYDTLVTLTGEGAAGDKLSKDVIETVVRDRAGLHYEPVTVDDVVRGVRLKGNISPGTVLTRGNTAIIPPVASGERVRVTYQNGALSLSTWMTARENGFLNDIIRFENPRSNALVKGRVTARGNAVVYNGGGQL